MTHLSSEQLNKGLDEILKSPKDSGVLDQIVRRPAVGEREILKQGELSVAEGLVGDNWLSRGSRHMPDGVADVDMQLNIMNTRVVSLVAQDPDRWQLAGDQLFVDMNLSKENLPAGTQLAIGTAVVEVTATPHTGCKKFVARFGLDAMVFVNSGVGKELCLRGICAKVVKAGTINIQDLVRKVNN